MIVLLDPWSGSGADCPIMSAHRKYKDENLHRYASSCSLLSPPGIIVGRPFKRKRLNQGVYKVLPNMNTKIICICLTRYKYQIYLYLSHQVLPHLTPTESQRWLTQELPPSTSLTFSFFPNILPQFFIFLLLFIIIIIIHFLLFCQQVYSLVLKTLWLIFDLLLIKNIF